MEKQDKFERRLDASVIMSVVAAGLLSFTGVVVETAMNVTFPSLMQEFSVDTSSVQWITTGYLLMLAVIIPASSWLKKNFAMKKIFITAVSLFILGTVMSMVSPVFSILLAGRILQGIGTGIALPLMYNIVLEQVPYDKMGFVMGLASLVCAMAPAVGPSFGGLVVEYMGWRMIFACLLPVLIFSFIAGTMCIRQSSVIEKTPFETNGYLLMACGFAAFILASSFSGAYGWTDPRVIGLFAVSFILIGLFAKRSLNLSAPLLDLRAFATKPYTFATLSLVLAQFICLGLGFLIPNYAQLVRGENAFIAGCILFPGCVLGAVLNPVAGRILDRYGAKRPMLGGFGLILICTALFAHFYSAASVAAMTGFYVLFAAGQGFAIGTTLTHALKSLPEKLSGDGNAIVTTLQQLAGAFGTAVISSVVSAAQKADPSHLAAATEIGAGHGFLLLAVLALVLLACAHRSLEEPREEQSRVDTKRHLVI